MSANVRHSSATAEHYTPAEIVDAARLTLGAIDLDPFSCVLANETVRAEEFFDAEDDGFALNWWGRVFCNPPGGKDGSDSLQRRAWFKLAAEMKARRVSSAIFVCFDLGLLQTTQTNPPPGLALPLDFPICYFARRIAYRTNVLPGPTAKRPDRKPTRKQIEDFERTGTCIGESPPHPSCIVGAGMWGPIFRQHFEYLGRVVIPQIDRPPLAPIPDQDTRQRSIFEVIK